MFFNREKVLGFGKKGVELEKRSPSEALRKLYETDEEIAQLIYTYAKQREQVLVFNDVTQEDRNLLESAEQNLINKLAEQGVHISIETLDELMSTF